MRRLTMFIAALALAMSLPSPGSAQLHPQPGDRVRILTSGGRTLIGTVTLASPEGMVVSGNGGALSVPQAQIAHLERSAARYRRFGRNFTLTVGGGAVLGAVLAAATWSPCVSNYFLGCIMAPESRGDAFVLGGVVGGILGVPGGVILGLVLRYDRWEAMSLPGTEAATVSIRPVLDRGLGVAASISF